jgi:hypothetical protein
VLAAHAASIAVPSFNLNLCLISMMAKERNKERKKKNFLRKET